MPNIMDPAPFEQLLAEHHRLAELANELELRLYRMGELPPDTPGADCQQAAGALIGQLRKTLFRWDQEVLPRLDPQRSVPAAQVPVLTVTP